jgi:hypothetical protein
VTNDLEEARVRAGRNQALFREVNERIGELSRSWATSPQFVCECLNTRCAETVALSVEEYERVRADPACFLVVHGHEVAEVEETVAETDRYLVVRKLGSGHTIAVRSDPRQAGDGALTAWLP